GQSGSFGSEAGDADSRITPGGHPAGGVQAGPATPAYRGASAGTGSAGGSASGSGHFRWYRPAAPAAGRAATADGETDTVQTQPDAAPVAAELPRKGLLVDI